MNSRLTSLVIYGQQSTRLNERGCSIGIGTDYLGFPWEEIDLGHNSFGRHTVSGKAHGQTLRPILNAQAVQLVMTTG